MNLNVHNPKPQQVLHRYRHKDESRKKLIMTSRSRVLKYQWLGTQVTRR